MVAEGVHLSKNNDLIAGWMGNRLIRKDFLSWMKIATAGGKYESGSTEQK